MTDKKELAVTEGNKLIAEFMGGILWSSVRNGEQDKIKMSTKVFPDKMYTCKIINLKYHTSWDWLMPVVKKIRDYLDNEIQRPSRNHCCKGDAIEVDIQCGLMVTDIDKTWQAVVVFIQWYNNQTPTK